MLFLYRAFVLFFIASAVLNTYLYLYPIFSNGCDFPSPDDPSKSPFFIFSRLGYALNVVHASPSSAPFRLLAFGDPQLEGDTSIWYPDTSSFRPSTLVKNLRTGLSLREWITLLHRAVTDLTDAIPAHLRAWWKQLDLLGNDYYLAHIYRTLRAHTRPTHVAVLGDLLGSQWIDDDEFARRADRFWSRVFKGGMRVEDEITLNPTIEPLGEDAAWSRRVINVAGNHDVGYAGDLTSVRLARFERAFGAANWEIVFQLPSKSLSSPTPPTAESGAAPPVDEQTEQGPFLRLVMLNSMNLDTPALDPALQAQTYDFLNAVITRSQPVEDRRVGTLLLTHIPLHKPAGVCADAPRFDFYPAESASDGVGVREQNHLSYNAGKGVLEGLYGMSGDPAAPGAGLGRQGLILTGHDHEGCDVCHYLPVNEADPGDVSARSWNVTRWEEAREVRGMDDVPGIREVTLRSMMGEFGGWAYLVSAWFEEARSEWRFEVRRCGMGVQHWWWAGHVLGAVMMGIGVVIALLETGSFLGSLPGSDGRISEADGKRIGKQDENGSSRSDNVPRSTGRELEVGDRYVKKRRR